MRIGHAAKLTGLTIKAIRHYESAGLLGELEREGSYRDLTEDDVSRLRLIAHCRGIGFGIPEIRSVLALVERAEPECPDPRAMLDLVRRRRAEVARAIAALEAQDVQLAAAEEYVESRLSTLP